MTSYENKPEIKNNLENAYYSPKFDYISIPKKEQFESIENYYSVLFHELVHSTGSENRLKRKTVTDSTIFGSENYSKEELIAELGSSFLCCYSKIEQKTIDNSASYIAGWLKALKNDKGLIIYASAQASKAFEYMIKNIDKNKSIADKKDTSLMVI